ncbi:hypothetical protein FF36_01310 [Frankia torreyi]|uniref:Uncharacterized protein n=1 Tax=Frankia torreyi TaxID=1856 RepID=A0A0D8BJK2_9ACTN|nr:hypothetical protein FF36_01310 [Frankia torreyi]KQM06889.1 hypothetical protein FF86_1006142 [Frankia sp. CpI1-P]
MLSLEEYPDVLVTVAHPWGNVEVPVDAWIQTGPGPRPYVGIAAARRSSTGREVPLTEIPLEYHNSSENPQPSTARPTSVSMVAAARVGA